MNSVQLIGRLTKDVDLRQTQSGNSVGAFTLAVDRNFTNQQGEREADFIRCVAWRKTAEILAQYTHKGARVGVEGRIQTRNYDDPQGNRVYVTEVVVDQVHLLESRGGQQGQQNVQQQAQRAPQRQYQAPQQTEQVTQDDLPF